MTNRLTTLLSQPTLERRVDDYEAVFDDFVRFARGTRISEAFAVPIGTLNADYYFDRQQFEITLELKQLSAYEASKTVDQYWAQRLSEGKIKSFQRLTHDKIRIGPESLSTSDWNDFYKRFRPSVSTDLKKAHQQLKASEGFMPAPRTRRVKGVMLVNTGDYNLPTDLLLRLVEWRMKREWKAGHFRSIDFVGCATIDMFKQQQHPLHTRYIVRSAKDDVLVRAAWYINDRWIHYYAAAAGMTVEYQEEATLPETKRDLSQPFAGKLQRR